MQPTSCSECLCSVVVQLECLVTFAVAFSAEETREDFPTGRSIEQPGGQNRELCRFPKQRGAERVFSLPLCILCSRLCVRPYWGLGGVLPVLCVSGRPLFRRGAGFALCCGKNPETPEGDPHTEDEEGGAEGASECSSCSLCVWASTLSERGGVRSPLWEESRDTGGGSSGRDTEDGEGGAEGASECSSCSLCIWASTLSERGGVRSPLWEESRDTGGGSSGRDAEDGEGGAEGASECSSCSLCVWASTLSERGGVRSLLWEESRDTGGGSSGRYAEDGEGGAEGASECSSCSLCVWASTLSERGGVRSLLWEESRDTGGGSSGRYAEDGEGGAEGASDYDPGAMEGGRDARWYSSVSGCRRKGEGKGPDTVGRVRVCGGASSQSASC
uniref:Uncharacterized protein n=1 Tax=Chromera velia CCMP2878 TaxID=1169474 RepID=A0A0G4HNF2_9ALVE|eukprot:Cvel_29451.t1-p1 / transcript=Cvel_29451.t1 / gene=Cvel_29451 / organism=Chromera_velia_CCMP2878 / gene_product=hypothetical protein / transcript_product=hypothetical protein / location=Cvel_scaffold4030:1528-2688(-) / protein_length=387 / sequence_SO=supercontig / SO=protein_coding / is_pseudo=false